MPDVMGVVSIHGNFGTQEPASTTIDYKTRVLVLHGASDNNIMNTVARGDNSGAMPGLEKELGDAKIPWEITKFAGVGHGFAAQGRSYDADATERSWASLGDFFGELFKTAVMELPDQPDDASGDIVTEMITYLDGNQTLEGYLAYSKTHSAKGLLPSVLVSHDWDGITEHERTWARSLAAHGYLAFTSAVFTPEEDAAAELPDYAARGRITGRYASDPELHRTRMQAAVAVVEGRAESMKGEVAAVGFCFGGGSVLELARANVTGVKGVVSMHGSLGTKMPAEGDMATRVLVLHGAIDNNIISAQRGDNGGVMPAFEAEMDGANAKWEVTRYSGVVHSFTEPAAGDNVASGNAYDSYAAKRAWSSTLDFLNEVLEKPAPAMAVPAMAMEETDMESGAEKAAATFAACLAVLATVFLAF
jgi:dienelactone hydrolase